MFYGQMLLDGQKQPGDKNCKETKGNEDRKGKEGENPKRIRVKLGISARKPLNRINPLLASLNRRYGHQVERRHSTKGNGPCMCGWEKSCCHFLATNNCPPLKVIQKIKYR